MKQLLLLCIFLNPLCTHSQSFSFEQLFDEHPALKQVATNPNHQVQIIYTQINRNQQNEHSFQSFHFQVDSSRYFYPASTVKMPTAFLALQRLNELGLEKHTPVKIGANRFVQTAVAADSTSANGLPSMAHYIKKLFVLSDNDAYNRLFEFLGQQYINSQLRQKGYHDSRVKHRLVGGYDGVENQYVNPIWFYDNDGTVLYQQAGDRRMYPFQALQKEGLIRGKGYWDGTDIQNNPFDFSEKNSIGLQDLHDQLQAVLFPKAVPPCRRFQLSDEDYQFLYRWMAALPRHTELPKRIEPDQYVKFLLFGDDGPEQQIPSSIRMLNKVGFAYGFVTDVAYIADREHGVEFLLAAQLLVNKNQIFNDGEYEYEDIAIPFLDQLGKAIYQHELQRERQFSPDVSKFFIP